MNRPPKKDLPTQTFRRRRTPPLPTFQAPKGMHDLLPVDTLAFEKLRRITKEITEFYGFELIETPLVEPEDLFRRGIGYSTDIVEKEMYTLRTKGGDRLALRPEGTAGVVRAYIQNGLASWSQPVKLWYWGPMFRHETPQKGRFRQFNQFGLEYFGESHPAVDVEIMQVVVKILEGFGLKSFHLEVNSMGCQECRPRYKNLLKAYYRNRTSRLCQDCKRRLKENPLRLLDCKNEVCMLMKEGAPEIVEHLCQACRGHLKTTLEFLDELSIPYLLNPYLARGFDYYSRTVFEFVPINGQEELKPEVGGTSLKAIGGGGRYDYLMSLLGGPDTPAVGAAVGIERTVAAWREQGGKNLSKAVPKVFLAQIGELAKRKTLAILEDFRKANIDVATSLGRDSFKAQLKAADRFGVPYALILGQKEAFDGSIILRDMRSGVQESIPLEKVVDTLKEKLREK